MRLPSFPPGQVLASPSVDIVDLRSPAEFARDHLPGARNVPLFDDNERAIVGTLYKQQSPASAYAKGLSLVEQGIGELLQQILQRDVSDQQWQGKLDQLAAHLKSRLGKPVAELDLSDSLATLGPRPLVVHCWRGGMRSQSVALLLRALGEDHVGLLDGGYKAYRSELLEQLSRGQADDYPLIVVRGRTGVGKTQVLHQLERLWPNSTLDLEGLACHRSSALGAVGLAPVSQPLFESQLVARVAELKAAGGAPWFVEGESRKVGDSVLPSALYQALQSAPEVRLTLRKSARVDRLGVEYLGDGALRGEPDERRLREVAAAVGSLKQPLGGQSVNEMQAWLARGEWRPVVSRLLDEHYDPHYDRGGHPDGPRLSLDAADPDLLEKLGQLRDSLGAGPGASE